jgi:hypothetical protein
MHKIFKELYLIFLSTQAQEKGDLNQLIKTTLVTTNGEYHLVRFKKPIGFLNLISSIHIRDRRQHMLDSLLPLVQRFQRLSKQLVGIHPLHQHCACTRGFGA